MLIDATKRGYGIAIIAEVLIEPELNEGTLVQVHPFRAVPESSYYLLTPDAKAGIARIQRFKSLLLSALRDIKN